MKKLYTTLALAAAVSLGASATVLNISPKETAKHFPAVKKTETLRMADCITNSAPAARRVETKAVPTGEWNNLGTGKYSEDLLTIFSDIESGMVWDVTIYESATTPGYYRVAPYTAESPIGQMMDGADESAIFYINATNPDKVYVEGDITIYGSFIVSHCVPENQWQDSMYGTLKDKLITFPANSWGIYMNNGWYGTNSDGALQIALPGAVIKDYSLRLSAPFCTEDNNIPVTLQVGADVASLRYTVMPGYYTTAGGNADIVAQIGTQLAAQSATISLPLANEQGLFSLMVAALDKDGKVVSHATVRAFGQSDNAADWETIGTGIFTEPYFSSIFSDIDPEDLEVTVQRHKTTANYYRLVEPYANHSVLKQGHTSHASNHNHYLYINATNPDRVYVEASPAGITVGNYGEALLWSWAGRYVEAERADQAAQDGLYGSLKDGVITMPDDCLLFALSNDNNGDVMDAGQGFVLKLPANTEGVEGVEIDTVNGPAEYFNLQGVRVAEPSAGLYIRRAGNKVEKVYVK